MTVHSQSGRKWTYEDYAAIPPDLLRHEIIDGEHFVNSAPSLYHQEVSVRLAAQLFRAIAESGLGMVYCAPIDVQLSEHDVVQPDLVVVLEGNRDILIPSRVMGPPDLVIEILSPSTRTNDRTRKKDLYCEAGVPEYWIVDSETHTVQQYRHRAGVYELVATANDEITTPYVTLDLTRIW